MHISAKIDSKVTLPLTKKHENAAKIKIAAILLSAQHLKDKRFEAKPQNLTVGRYFKDEESVEIGIY